MMYLVVCSAVSRWHDGRRVRFRWVSQSTTLRATHEDARRDHEGVLEGLEW